MKEVIPFYLRRFERIIRDNKGFAVGNSVSYHNIFKYCNHTF